MIKLSFYTLTGPFAVDHQAEFPTFKDADAAVEAYAAEHGFSRVKQVDDDDPTCVRYTATSPGGRAGRNVAFGDFDPYSH